MHRVERAVGEPVEAAVRTDTYFDLVTKATRTTEDGQADGRRARRRACCTCSTCPPDSDVRRMREQLSRMERRLNQLSEDVSELETRTRRLMPPTLNPLDLVTRINRDVERSLLRARNGVRYVRGTHAPERRRDAQGGRVAARQGRALALPQRHRSGTARRC